MLNESYLKENAFENCTVFMLKKKKRRRRSSSMRLKYFEVIEDFFIFWNETLLYASILKST